MPQSIKPFQFQPIDKPATPLAASMTAVRLPQHIHNLIASKFESGYDKSAWLRKVIEAAAIAQWPEDFAEPVPEPEPKSTPALEPNNYELLYSRFVESGNTKEVAKKAALYILNAASDYEPIEEILSHCSKKHHQFIIGVVESVQLRERENEKELDAIADTFNGKVIENIEALESFVDSPLKGSLKQQKWARSIRSFAVENWLAHSVASGEMEYHEALNILKNPDSKYWIDNRKEWGCR